MSWVNAYLWRTLVVPEALKTNMWVFLWEQCWMCLARMLHDSCRKVRVGVSWAGCCISWGRRSRAGRSAGLDILGCPWRWQQSESPCRPASSGVIGLSENSCHLLSAVHYHFFLSHLRSLWLAGCGSHSMTISVLSGRWVLLFWECELEKNVGLERHNFTCPLQAFSPSYCNYY